MSSQSEKPRRVPDTSTTTRCLWVTLEAEEVIELKRITMDADADGAVAYFSDLLLPRVLKAATQRGIAQDIFEEKAHHERIPG